MENNMNNTPENQESQQGTQNLYTDSNTGANQTQYTDPNAGVNQAQYTDPNAGVNQAQYTDPNAGVNQAQYTDSNAGGYTQYTDMNTGYTQDSSTQYGYQQAGQNYNTNYQQQYQDNYNYNVGSNATYNQNNTGLDTTPLTMGEWILTLLVMMIPCVNIVMLFVWAFGKTGNVNRRNFCRAELIFMGIGVALGIVMCVIVAVAGIGASTYYY